MGGKICLETEFNLFNTTDLFLYPLLALPKPQVF